MKYLMNENEKERIGNILSKCNNFNYKIRIENLYLKINTKKIYRSLIHNSYNFKAKENSITTFSYNKLYNYFFSSKSLYEEDIMYFLDEFSI